MLTQTLSQNRYSSFFETKRVFFKMSKARQAQDAWDVMDHLFPLGENNANTRPSGEGETSVADPTENTGPQLEVSALQAELAEQQRLIQELRAEMAAIPRIADAVATPSPTDTTDQTQDQSSDSETSPTDPPNPEIPSQNLQTNPPSLLDLVDSPTPVQGTQERLQDITSPNHTTAQRAQRATPFIAPQRTAEMNQEIANHQAELRDVLDSPVSAAEALLQTQQNSRDAERAAIEQVIANAGNRTTVHDLSTRLNRTEAQAAEILTQLQDRDIVTVNENGTYTLKNESERTFTQQETNEVVQDAEYTTSEKVAYVKAMNEYFAIHCPSKRRNAVRNIIPKNGEKSDTPLWKTQPLIEIKSISTNIPMSELKKYFQYLSNVAPQLKTPHEIQISSPFNQKEMDELLSSEEQSPIIGKAKGVSGVNLDDERSVEELKMHQEKIKLLHALQKDISSSNTTPKVMKSRLNRFLKNEFAIEPRNEIYGSAATKQEVLDMAEEIVGLSDNDDIKQFIDSVIEQNRGTGENVENIAQDLPKAKEPGIIDGYLTIRDMEKLIINDILAIQKGIDILKGQYESMLESVAKTATLEDIKTQEMQIKALVSRAKERGLLQNFNT